MSRLVEWRLQQSVSLQVEAMAKGLSLSASDGWVWFRLGEARWFSLCFFGCCDFLKEQKGEEEARKEKRV